MLRTFTEHTLRRILPLDGTWEFTEKSGSRGRPDRFSRRIPVPSVWEKLPGLETYRGKAWFRREIPVEAGLHTLLVFGGVSHTGKVFVDGTFRGGHQHAYSGWSVVVPPPVRTRTAGLVVEVDNSYGPATALHRAESDFYTYGGIVRPVEAHFLPDVFIERMALVPVRRSAGWDLNVSVTVRNLSRKDLTRSLSLEVRGRKQEWNDVLIGRKKGHVLSTVLKGLKAESWSPESPVLYAATAVLSDAGRAVDDLIDRIGFREVRVRGREILLNGTRLKLKGYNRHEDHGSFGCAIPAETMASDLSLLQDLGCNCVRTSHYQNDSRFLDLCDERGMLVWEESLAWQTPFTLPGFLEEELSCTREMVEQHINHPSIVLWGALNECDTKTPMARSVHAKVLGLIRELDASRPVTYGGNHGKGDTCLGFCDVVSWNRYDAWYQGGISRVAPNLEDMLKWLDSKKSRGGAGKPVLLSEFGAAGLYGNRQTTRQRWSEEYQAEVLDESLKVYLDHPRLSGALIWQFADCRVNEGSWYNRPRCHNNKGTLDEYRRPKLCYEVVRRRMRGSSKKGE